jgi:general secretion pathway protein A
VNHPENSLEACYQAMGLSEAPFRITPDTQFFFPHGQYLSALGHLRFGILSGGFTVLTGEVGLGKTLLCRYLLRNMPEGGRTAFIYNPQQTFEELMRSIIHDLTDEIPQETSLAELQNKMLGVLSEIVNSGQRVAVLVDEAHRLKPEVLEGLRLLSNLETEKRKLLSLLLVGQTELEEQLKQRNMRALRERISVWHRLKPFNQSDTADYVEHRLNLVRQGGRVCFSRRGLFAVHHYSKGIPRRINLICDRALLAAYVGQSGEIGFRMVRQAAREVFGLAAGD